MPPIAPQLERVDESQSMDVSSSRSVLDEDGRPDISVLEDRMPEWAKWSRATSAIVGALGVLFCVWSFRTIAHTDVWGHLSYARWLWQHGTFPATEPLMALAVGVPFMDTAWLSQLIGFGMYSGFGVVGLQFLYAAAVTTAVGILAFAVFHRTNSVTAALLGVGAFLWVDYQQFLIVRPQLVGVICFVSVLVLATSVQWDRRHWLLIPAVFALWANCHGSFPVGLLLLGTLWFGRVVDVYRRTGRIRMVLADRPMRRLLLVTELAAAAVLLNPYGIGLYGEVLNVAGNPNLRDLVEWDALTLRMSQGQAAAVVAFVLVCLYRTTPRRIGTAEVLLLTGLGVSALWSSRLIVWWAPVAAYYLAIHAAASWKRRYGHEYEESPRGGLWTVVSLGLAWISFAYTPFGVVLLHGQPAEAEARQERFEKSVSMDTPLGPTDYLRRNPPQGQVFNTYEWGDYLLWAGPKEIQVFVASHAHLIPEEVWQDYMQIAHAAGNWSDRLDRYGVNTVVVDKRYRSALIRGLEELPETWTKAYEDRNGVVFNRVDPI